jgi:hypothetical protein
VVGVTGGVAGAGVTRAGAAGAGRPGPGRRGGGGAVTVTGGTLIVGGCGASVPGVEVGAGGV